MHRLGDADSLSRGDSCPCYMIPAMQLFERDTEAIRNLDQRVAAARLVSLGMSCRRSNWSNGNHQRVDIVESIAGAKLVDGRQLLLGHAIAARDAGQRVLRSHAMIAPLCAPVLRDLVDALQWEWMFTRRFWRDLDDELAKYKERKVEVAKLLEDQSGDP